MLGPVIFFIVKLGIGCYMQRKKFSHITDNIINS